jgi:hypothetical protein
MQVRATSIRRTILAPPFSKIADDLQVLRDHLSLYRLALGQSDEEALIHAPSKTCGGCGRRRGQDFGVV